MYQRHGVQGSATQFCGPALSRGTPTRASGPDPCFDSCRAQRRRITNLRLPYGRECSGDIGDRPGLTKSGVRSRASLGETFTARLLQLSLGGIARSTIGTEVTLIGAHFEVAANLNHLNHCAANRSSPRRRISVSTWRSDAVALLDRTGSLSVIPRDRSPLGG